MGHKILLDTDIGNDIDDAVCLAYLLAQRECELLGITSVGPEPVVRAAIADAICRHAGQDVPVHAGAGHPLMGRRYWYGHLAHQADALPRWPHRDDFAEGTAVEFLRSVIHAHPHEVTLVAIGPMTNVALLFGTDPACVRLLKGLVLMCGRFSENPHRDDAPLECNAMLDPVAAAITYHHAPPLHRTVPGNITRHVRLEADAVRERFQSRVLEPVRDFAEVFFQRSGGMTFHDPLAAATIFDDSLCRFESGHAEVELGSPRVQGMTYFRRDPEGPHELATAVDPERFFTHYFGVVDDA